MTSGIHKEIEPMAPLDGLLPVEQKAACLAWLVSARRWLIDRGRDADGRGCSTLAPGELDTLRNGIDQVSMILADDLRAPDGDAVPVRLRRFRVIDGGESA